MKSLVLFTLIGGFTFNLAAQQLERTVLGSAAAYHTHPTVGSLHWTTGEMIVEEYQNGLVLSQGFHQGTIEVISGIDKGASYGESISVKVFPNPAFQWLQVETKFSGKLEIMLTDLLGRRLLTDTMEHKDKFINLQPLPSGIYFLSIMQKGQPIRTFRIQKVDS